jgi:8-oxo-dGTP pyrophosphatase MutT (NUDIX family)
VDFSRTKVIACATVIEEMAPLVPASMQVEALEFGLHLRPERLREALQRAVDESAGSADTILLGYGLCSNAVVGLRSDACTLVVPKVDDCIALFLGSRAAYRREARREPGTYYLTKGWIEAGGTPFSEHRALVERYGEARARRMSRLALRNYTRLVFIETGTRPAEQYRAWARRAGEEFGLRCEEIRGDAALLKKMIYGPWDDEIIVVRPGRAIAYADFDFGSWTGEENAEGAG